MNEIKEIKRLLRLVGESTTWTSSSPGNLFGWMGLVTEKLEELETDRNANSVAMAQVVKRADKASAEKEAAMEVVMAARVHLRMVAEKDVGKTRKELLDAVIKWEKML
ncbi:MAG: hypothetical protein ACXABY_11275 [Candidatus Thorarchaeota archaeon]|jgi:hypothetical protein